jgi:hypothetical protein
LKHRITFITPLGMDSALNRNMRENTVSSDTYEKIFRFRIVDIGLFIVLPFYPLVIEKAAAIIDSHGARTLGAIPMGSALVVNQGRIVTSDRRMLEIHRSLPVDRIQMI